MCEFIPQKIEKCIISIRLPCATLNSVDKVAETINISRNDLMNQCLEFALTHCFQKGKKVDDKSIRE